MYVNKVLEKRTGRILLCYAVSERVNGKSTTRNVMRIGYVDELEKEYPDPVAHFKEEAIRLTKESQGTERKIDVTIAADQKLMLDGYGRYDTLKNLGSVFLMCIMHEMGLEALFRKLGKRHGFGFSLFEVMKFLVYQRVLDPDGGKVGSGSKGRYFEKMDFTLDDIDRALSCICQEKAAIIQHLDSYMRKERGRKPGLSYYYVMDYGSRVVDEMEERSVEHHQLGLLTDGQGFPITFSFYEGDAEDHSLIIPSMKDISSGHFIIVADKNICTEDDIIRIIQGHNGYILYQSARRPALTEAAPEQDYQFGAMPGMVEHEDYPEGLFEYRGWNGMDRVAVRDAQGKKRLCEVRKRIIFWNRKVTDRERPGRQEGEIPMEVDPWRLRGEELEEECYLIETNVRSPHGPVDVKSAGHSGGKEDVSQSISVEELDELTMRIRAKKDLWLEDDGRFVIDHTVTDKDIIDMCSGLWRIEEDFRLSKLEFLQSHLPRRERIVGHYMICLISYLLVCLLQDDLRRTGRMHSYESIIESLGKCLVSDVDGSNYILVYYDQVLDDLQEALGITGIHRVISRKEMRSICASAKRRG